jgi:hypothetical protein
MLEKKRQKRSSIFDFKDKKSFIQEDKPHDEAERNAVSKNS